MYRATDTRLGREVALKVLPEAWPPTPTGSPDSSARRGPLAALDHPGIVDVYSVEEAGRRPLPDDGARRGRVARRSSRAGGAAARAGARRRARAGRRAGRRAREGNRPPRPQARQRHGRRRDGRVKVLDFGLAKLAGPASRRDAGPQLPTAVGDADPRGRRDGHGALHVARAALGPRGRRPDATSSRSGSCSTRWRAAGGRFAATRPPS